MTFRRAPLFVVLATALLMLIPTAAWSSVPSSVEDAPSAARGESSYRFDQFWSRIGPGIRVGCYISWIANTDDPPETRCDRYRTVNGEVRGEVQLLMEDLGRGKRVYYTDSVGDRVGKRLRPGQSFKAAGHIRCTARKKSMRCYDSYTEHGFVSKRRGYRVF